jgi:ubiquinone/menaquinone biosynthesis C-methylase UbiE
MGLGFRPQNIEAIDLISYSPWVTLADMHAIPFPDDSFDVVMHGWVLVYSVNPRKAAQELVRVCRNRAVIAISADWSGPRSSSKSDDPLDIHAEAYFQNCDQILDCFPKESIGPIYVRQEAEDYPGVHPRRPREQGSSILVFEIRK